MPTTTLAPHWRAQCRVISRVRKRVMLPLPRFCFRFHQNIVILLVAIPPTYLEAADKNNRFRFRFQNTGSWCKSLGNMVFYIRKDLLLQDTWNRMKEREKINSRTTWKVTQTNLSQNEDVLALLAIDKAVSRKGDCDSRYERDLNIQFCMQCTQTHPKNREKMRLISVTKLMSSFVAKKLQKMPENHWRIISFRKGVTVM